MGSLRHISARGSAALLVLIVCVGPLLGRQHQPHAAGSLRGRVIDERGGLIVGASVTLSSADGDERKTATDGEGVYRFEGLAAGAYVVRADARGFAPFERQGVSVSAVRGGVLDIELAVGLERQEVTVESAQSAGTEPDTNASAVVLRGADLDALPDDPEALAASLRALAGPASGPDGGEIYVDGFSAARPPSKSSIREVRVNQNPFSAEFDRLGFGRIEILTKAGASKYEGGLFFSFNDESLNARVPFSASRAPFQARRYGGTLSGPLFSKRSSFFLDFERRETDDNAFVSATVLDAALNVARLDLSVPAPQRRDSLSLRFDRQLDANNSVAARYTFNDTKTENAGVGDFSLPSRAYRTSGDGHSLQATLNSVIRRKFINN